MLFLALGLALSFVIGRASPGRGSELLIALGLGAAAVWALQWIAVRRTLHRLYRDDLKIADELSIRGYDDRLELTQGPNTTSWSWSGVKGLEERGGYLYLLFTELQGWAVPLTAFASEGEKLRVSNFVEERVGRARSAGD